MAHGGAPAGDKDFPYWLVAAGALAIAIAVLIASNDLYSQVLTIVSRGLWIT
jgi:polar amino acid transport system permease protein